MTTQKERNKNKKKVLEKIGRLGEKEVDSIITDYLEQNNKIYKKFRNVILQDNSIFGNEHGMTTELDEIIVTQQFIFIFEIKKTNNYKKVYDEYWILNDGKPIINPIKQNHIHKLVLAHKLNLKPNNIVTVECLYSFPKKKSYNQFKKLSKYNNDVCLLYSKETFLEALNTLFNYNNPNKTFDYNKINKQIITISKVSDSSSRTSKEFYKNVHKKNIESSKMILSKNKNLFPSRDLFSVGVCPRCNKATFKIMYSASRFKYFCTNSRCNTKFTEKDLYKIKIYDSEHRLDYNIDEDSVGIRQRTLGKLRSLNENIYL